MIGIGGNTGRIMVAVLIACSVADAGIDDHDNGPGMSTWRDELTLTGPMPDLYEIMAVRVEYCVYYPGYFSNYFPGQDPTGGTEYIYAYQLFNNIDPHPSVGTGYGPDYVDRFSVGLDQDESADNCSYVPGTGIVPVPDVLTAGSTQAGWTFGTTAMAWSTDPAAISAVLYFSSPNSPEDDRTTLSGWQSAGGWLPSPSSIPEPTVMTVMAVGLALGVIHRRRKL